MLLHSVPGRARSDEGGFTLIEAVMGISIILLLAGGISIGVFRGFSRRWKAREAASYCIGVLRRARWLAISEGRDYGVLFSQPGEEGACLVSLLRRNPLDWAPVEPAVALPSSVTELKTTGSSVKEFNSDGTCSTGSVVLSCRDGSMYRITLTPSTGRIRVYREEG